MRHDRDLESFAREHICYEVEMLTQTAALLPRLTEGTVEHNAILESFLVHARLLDDFLGAPASRKDDVVAGHYLSTWHPSHPLTDTQRWQANKWVAHLTRVRDGKQPIDVGAMLLAVAAGLRCFLDALPHDRRAWFEHAGDALVTRPAGGVITTTTTSLNESYFTLNGEVGQTGAGD